ISKTSRTFERPQLVASGKLQSTYTRRLAPFQSYEMLFEKPPFFSHADGVYHHFSSNTPCSSRKLPARQLHEHVIARRVTL
ncbi:MAG TPA: hypothetical protein VFB55_05305, partial [Verrucomicrobiae bacterium]|nr:hypothetical protein [Verrucomicrobiae bacterium]